MPLLQPFDNKVPVISYLPMVNVSGTALFSFTNLIMLWVGAAPHR
jgi:hypothetical protein